MYESLVLMPLETKDGKPLLACYICYARLENCYELRRCCLQSEELLTLMLSSNESDQVKLQGINSKKRLTMHNVVHLSIGHELEMNADNVGVEALKCEVKLEPNDCEDTDEDALEDNSVSDIIQSADSDDGPLMIVKKEQSSDLNLKRFKKAVQRNPEDLTSRNLENHELIHDTLQEQRELCLLSEHDLLQH
ncbi:unnamed protein product [Arctia plantaginis]|uniref:Uncharacterized protein n=1 Tax=Arctia plantaginis TaxID=874455 RepID=A0A8S1AZZ7_ARCPL|nr:unnamed protein product [Arctia plantaginis]